MKYIYNTETRSFIKNADEEEQAALSPHDWSKINASKHGAGIYHYTDAKGYYGIRESGSVSVSNRMQERLEAMKPVVWLTKSDFWTSSIASRIITDFYSGVYSNGHEYRSMLRRYIGANVEIPRTIYIPVRFEICANSLRDGSVRLVSWAEYKSSGFINKRTADGWEVGDKLAKADPQKTFMLSYEDIPAYCFIEPKVMKEGEWVSICELDDIINCLPDGCFIDARINRNGQWIPVADIPND